MPVLKVFFDERLDDAVRRAAGEMQAGLAMMMRDCLKADPAKCQVIFCASIVISPAPIYADMQFRANDHRTPEVVAEAMRLTAEILVGALGAAVRIRAFDIDQATLHALDVDGRPLS